MNRPASPKQGSQDGSRASSWYNYYAGYSNDFVGDVLTHLASYLGLDTNDLVGDPWNGAGTTTLVAREKQIRAWGGDVNPAMVVVAKARLLGAHVRPSEISICDYIISAASEDLCESSFEQDPLRIWFIDSSATVIRAIESEIGALLDPAARNHEPLTAQERVSGFSSLASFFYLALFRTTRSLLSPFRSSNPTWVKQPQSSASRIRPSFDRVADLFRAHVRDMSGAAGTVDLGQTFDRNQAAAARDAAHAQVAERSAQLADNFAEIVVAPSTALPLRDKSLAAVVSSPPYCTRIDYAVATAPELAVLGMNETDLRSLRDQMIGTSTIVKRQPAIDAKWGQTCARLLKRVGNHPSKASRSYYLKNQLQYFDGLSRSLTELNRVLRPGAPCILVVQDSYYKEVHIDLPTIVTEMGVAQGWRLDERYDYSPNRLMARLNKNAKTYRSTTTAVESVLVFEASTAH